MNRYRQEHSYKNTAFISILWLIVIILGLWLRIGSLETRTIHADEGVQGMISANLLESGEYAYNPNKFHGPSLYYLTLPVAWLRGQETQAALDIRTLRVVPFIFSLVICLAPFLFIRELGRTGVLVASGFLLLSPGMVYYGTFYIQETLLVAGFALFCGCYWRYRCDPGKGWAIGMGLTGGLMAASKESFGLYLIIVLFSGWIIRRKPGPQRSPFSWRDLGIAMVAACLVVVPFFSSFGSNPHGLVDAITGLYQYQPESGHDKPWYYYLSLLSGYSRGYLIFRGEGLLLTSAILSAAFLLFKGSNRQLGRFQAVVCFLLLLCFSLFSYKTPWLVMGSLFPMAILSGLMAGNLYKEPGSPARGLILMVVLLTAWGFSAREAFWTTRQFPVEKRNPYAYVHTSWDLVELTDRVIELSSTMNEPVIKVLSDEYWPIPWYLRGLDRVGYWSSIPGDPYAPVMVVSAELAGDLDPERMKAYRYEFRGLRPGKILLLYYLE